MKLLELLNQINDVWDREEAWRLYQDNFEQAIINEGFSPKQAGIIAYAAYKRGRLGGFDEVVKHAINLCSFAHEILDSVE